MSKRKLELKKGLFKVKLVHDDTGVKINFSFPTEEKNGKQKENKRINFDEFTDILNIINELSERSDFERKITVE